MLNILKKTMWIPTLVINFHIDANSFIEVFRSDIFGHRGKCLLKYKKNRNFYLNLTTFLLEILAYIIVF